jgi:DNA-directed RNA polymerase specialized sigma24 family protein
MERDMSDVALMRLSDAINELATLEPALAEVIDLKFFCGFSFEEIAEMRELSVRTVRRQWEKARLILFQEVGGGSPAYFSSSGTR